MRKIHILILKSYIGPLVITFFIAVFVLLMQFLWKYVDDMVGKGLEWYIIAELLFYASSTFVPLALPLAILLSSLMTFGNLGEHYELVAMKAAGISLWKIMKPLIVLSVMISAFAFYFSNNILPVANLKFKSLLYDVRKQKLAFDIKDGIFYKGMDEYVMRIGKKDKDGEIIHDIMIYNHTSKRGNVDLTIAESGLMESTHDGRYLVFTLYNGYNYRENIDQKDHNKTKPFQKIKFREEIRRFDLSAFELTRTNEELFKNNYQMLNISQLNLAIDSLNKSYDLRRKIFADDFFRYYFFYNLIDTFNYKRFDTLPYHPFDITRIYENKAGLSSIMNLALNQARNRKQKLEAIRNISEAHNTWIKKHGNAWHEKFTLSFACLIFFFIGAPLGAIIRKGGFGLPVIISIVFFVFYHIISITGEKSALAGAINVSYGMWIASVILLPMGIFLTYKATSDSPLLDTESWNKIFRKVFGKKKETH